MNKRFIKFAGAASIALLFNQAALADDAGMSSDVLAQIQAMASVKASFTPAQKKLSTGLAYGIMAVSNDSRVASFSNTIAPMTVSDVVPPSSSSGAPTSTSDQILVDIYGSNGDALANAITAAGGVVKYKSVNFPVINASLPISAVLPIAGRSDVRSIKSPSRAHSNAGAITSQGYITHEANKAVAFGYRGQGVTVGVLSDSALPARVAALKASGDLPATVQVLPGQDGPTTGEDEGAAMMEIVYDMAPGADLRFATAFTSEASFADNIIALAAAGCKVIVDDVSYFDEGVFQDGIVAQAVNQVTAAGVTYFSSAANSGSLTKGTSGTYEADFKDGGALTAPISGFEGGQGRFHNYSTTGTTLFNTINAATPYVQLKWSDPLAGSFNDYDVIVTNNTGTTILGVGADSQDGTGDPYEIAYRTTNTNFPAGSRVYIVKYSGVARAMHLDTVGGSTLSIATAGAVYGHNGGDKTVSVAATYWNSAKTGTKPFTGFPNTDEVFSSDGPRVVFYSPTGTPLTTGLLFATGGVTLQKPDIAAADGVSTKTPGFLPFYGTSAAAPHAAGIAALILSVRPNYTPDQVKTAIKATALDSMAVGVDRDSGYGVAMANAAVQYAISHP